MNALLEHGKAIAEKTSKDQVTVYAAQASFFIVIAVMPFLMLLMTLIQLIPALNKSDLLMVVEAVVPEAFVSIVENFINDLYVNSTSTVISITAITSLWSAALGMIGIERGLNRVYELPQIRGYLIHRLVCVVYTVIFITACAFTLILLVLGSSLERIINQWFPALAVLLEGIFSTRSIMALIVLAFIFAGTYTILPVHKRHFIDQVPGAIFSSVGWMICSVIISFYFLNFKRYSYTYGSMTALVVLMLWLYFCICILLIGAEINYHIEQCRAQKEKDA